VSNPFAGITGSAIVAFHDKRLEDAGRPVSGAAKFADGPWRCIEENHRFNARLWDEEELARRTEAPDSEIVANKRAIDRLNQGRNDAIERLDEALLARLPGKISESARLNSETAGSIIDRLSINSLRLRAMRAQAARDDAGKDHITACELRVKRLLEQREDLKGCLDALLVDCVEGRARFKVYRQYKMYNDPAFGAGGKVPGP
jgi:Protein of unknown function (DUF4254)